MSKIVVICSLLVLSLSCKVRQQQSSIALSNETNIVKNTTDTTKVKAFITSDLSLITDLIIESECDSLGRSKPLTLSHTQEGNTEVLSITGGHLHWRSSYCKKQQSIAQKEQYTTVSETLNEITAQQYTYKNESYPRLRKWRWWAWIGVLLGMIVLHFYRK